MTLASFRILFNNPPAMMFYTFFKSKIGVKIEITLRSDETLTGELQSVDPFLNFKLTNVTTTINALEKMKVCVVRGSNVKFAKVPYKNEDLDKLNDATRYKFM